MSTIITSLRSPVFVLCLAVVQCLCFKPTSSTADIITAQELPVSSQTLLNSAIELIKKRNLDAAREKLLQLSSDEKDLPQAEVLLAQLLIEQGMVGDGRRVLNEFSGLNPESYELHWTCCKLAVMESRWFDGWLLATTALELKMPTRWSDAQKARATAELQILKGACCEGRLDWRAAFSAYVAADEIADEKLPTAILGRARCHFHLGEIEAARAAFAKLKAQQPTASLPEVALAQLFDLKGNLVEAEKWYRLAITSSSVVPDNARLSFAQWLVWNNRPADAKLVLKFVAKDDGENERLYLSSLVARMEKRFDDAQKLLSALHQDSPTNFAISNQLALVLIENSDEAARARALQIAEVNVRNNQQLAEAWSTLGWIQFRLGDMASAQQSLGVAAQTGAISRDTAHFISKLQEKTGQTQIASQLQTAISEAKGPFFYASTEIVKD